MDSERLPITVGVTGHRNLRPEDRDRLRAGVAAIFDKLRRRHPSTPLLVLSSLAEGADRLVAEVALEQGMPIYAPLPMERAEYEKDFLQEKGSTEEFSRLLGRASGSFVVPFAAGVTAENVHEAENRSEQYAMAGKFILRHCHILLALWDGHRAEKTGGTSQMVRYRLSGFPVTDLPDWTALFPADAGPVYHLVTPRVSNPRPDGAYALRKYYTNFLFSGHQTDRENEVEAEKIFFYLLKRTDAFNRDRVRFHRKEPAFRRSAAQLAPATSSVSAPATAEPLLSRFGAADVMAGYYRDRRLFSLGLLSLFLIPASLLLADDDNQRFSPDQRWWCLLGFLFSVLISLFVVIWVRLRRIDAKYLDYRALAEGLRILYFWRMGGLHDDVAAQYLRKQRSELDWIRCAIRATDLPTSLSPPPADPFSWIDTSWIEDQRRYFGQSASRGKWWSVAWKTAITIGVTGAVLMATNMFFHRSLRYSGAYEWGNAVVALLATSGAIAAYVEKLGLSYQAKQYREMQRLFTNAEAEFHAALPGGDTRHLRAILRRLGHEALRENGDWLLLHRDLSIEMPVPGG